MTAESKLKTNNGDARQIGIAMSVACAIFIGFWQPPSEVIWFPLVGSLADPYAVGLLDALKLFFLGWLIWRGPTPSVLLLGAVSIAVTWLSRYSGMGAFVPQTVYNLLFFAAVAAMPGTGEEDQVQLKKSAALFASIVFIAAGFQKINESYLSGFEFLKSASFMGAYNHYFGALPGWLAVDVLPKFSILLEIGIGVGLLWRPKIFAHFAVLFVLLLSLLHPAVQFVYFTMAPMLVLIDSSVMDRVRGLRVRWLVTNEFFWVLFPMLSMASMGWVGKSMFIFFLRPWMTTFVLLGFHLWLLRAAWEHRRFDESPLRSLYPMRLKWISALLVVLAFTPVASLLGAPAPIGFTMFSGRGLKHARHEIRIGDAKTCAELQGVVMAFSTSDASFLWQDGEHCLIVGPTKSGADFVLDRLCKRPEIVLGVSLEYRPAADQRWRTHECKIGDG